MGRIGSDRGEVLLVWRSYLIIFVVFPVIPDECHIVRRNKSRRLLPLHLPVSDRSLSSLDAKQQLLLIQSL